jgi:hypothetical protein
MIAEEIFLNSKNNSMILKFEEIIEIQI